MVSELIQTADAPDILLNDKTKDHNINSTMIQTSALGSQ